MKDGVLFIYKKISPYRKSLLAAAILSIVSSVALVLIPGQLKEIVNYIEKNLSGSLYIGDVSRIIFLFACALILHFVCNYVQSILMTNAMVKFSADLRREFDQKLNVLPLSFLDRQSEGDLQSRMINDVDTISTSLAGTIGSIASNQVMLVLCLVLMLKTNLILSLSLIGATAIGFILFSIAFRISQPQFVRQQKVLGALNGQIGEVFTGHLVVKAFNCEEDVRKEFDNKNEELYKSSMLSRFLSDLMQPVMTFSGHLGYIAVCVTGAILLVSPNKSITIGDLVAFILYSNLFSTPITGLIQLASSLQPAVVCADRIREIVDAPEMPEEKDLKKLDEVEGDVSFSNVKFGYVPGQTIIHDLSATVKAGQKIAIVGKTGAGKSTLVNLLMRFYEIESGAIGLDGTPISSVSRENLHDRISMVLQEVWTFDGSIRENIVYGQENVTEDQLKEVLEETGLSYLVRTLPEGVDTVLNEQSGISAGQRQLVTIARAMIRNTPVLILDEATSNIDTRTEKLIQSAIDKLTVGRTSFVIAHRLSTIRNADQIFVMQDGDVVEIGAHEELLKKGGIYAELYYSQFDTENKA